MDQFFEDLLWQLRQTLPIAWFRMKAEVGEHVLLAVGGVAVVVLIWFFLSPGVKSR